MLKTDRYGVILYHTQSRCFLPLFFFFSFVFISWRLITLLCFLLLEKMYPQLELRRKLTAKSHFRNIKELG